LLVRVVAGAHHGANRSVLEAHGVSLSLEHLEGVGVHVALDREVRCAGRQVLTNGQHLNAMGTHIAHDLQNFFVGLTQADHDAALCGHIREQVLELFQQVEAELVVAAGACFFIEAGRRLQIVVHHIRWSSFQNFKRAVVAAPEVGHQYFDLRGGREFADAANAIYKVLSATIAQVVAVNAGDDDVFELEIGDGLGQFDRLVSIQRVRAAVADIAKRAAPGALVAHDHEGGGALAKAFTDVGATGFFAHRHQFVLAQHVLDFVKTGAGAAGLDANPVRFFEHLALHHLDRYARQLGGRLLFG